MMKHFIVRVAFHLLGIVYTDQSLRLRVAYVAHARIDDYLVVGVALFAIGFGSDVRPSPPLQLPINCANGP